ncbi:MAG: acyl-CoA dehydrogenase family protein [Acidimicrobiia bacterium]
MSTAPSDESPADQAFRAEARAFLEANAKPRDASVDLATTLGRTNISPENEADHVRECREWQATLAAGGWAGIAWPTEYGGRGGTPGQARIFAQEEAHFVVSSGAFAIAIGMVGPTIIAHGTEAQKEFFLSRMLNGEHVWCQLFSEPGAGSDLAGLATRAERDGDEWVVNGQKVWTSGAHFSDWGILLARTDWDAPKHRGITYFLVDMRSPGIEIRPLRQITGYAHFNEVFLTDVRIPAANMLGPLNGGWGVTQTTLANERAMIGGGMSGVTFDAMRKLAHDCARTDDPVVRQELARCYTRFEILKWLGQRARAAAKSGKATGSEASVMKLAISQRVARDGDLALALEGPGGMLSTADAPAGGMWQQMFLNQWSVRIGGGTEQIQKNVLGERVLGLPGEPRPDKTLPFRDLPRN